MFINGYLYDNYLKFSHCVETTIRCRNYHFGDPVVDYVSCNSECAVTIFKSDHDNYWRYYSMGCEQNCYPTNYCHFEVMYIKTCCFNDRCSLNVLHMLHPVFAHDVIVKRIDDNNAYNETSTTMYITEYTIATVSAVIAPSPVVTTVMPPSSPDRNGMT